MCGCLGVLWSGKGINSSPQEQGDVRLGMNERAIRVKTRTEGYLLGQSRTSRTALQRECRAPMWCFAGPDAFIVRSRRVCIRRGAARHLSPSAGRALSSTRHLLANVNLNPNPKPRRPTDRAHRPVLISPSGLLTRVPLRPEPSPDRSRRPLVRFSPPLLAHTQVSPFLSPACRAGRDEIRPELAETVDSEGAVCFPVLP